MDIVASALRGAEREPSSEGPITAEECIPFVYGLIIRTAFKARLEVKGFDLRMERLGIHLSDIVFRHRTPDERRKGVD